MENMTYEQSLVFAAKNGNEKCFETLYQKYYQKVYALALSTVKNAADAEDVLQMTFINAWQNLGTLEDISSFNTWLQRICHNQCVSLLRKRRDDVPTEELTEEEFVFNVEAELQSDMMLPQVYVERADLRARLMKLIDELSTVQRQTLTLHYFSGMSVEEIAKVMDVSEGTVKSRMFLARKALRTEIEEEERKTGQKFYGVAGPLIPLTVFYLRKAQASALSEASAAGVLNRITASITGAPAAPLPSGGANAPSAGTGAPYSGSAPMRYAAPAPAHAAASAPAKLVGAAAKASAKKAAAGLLPRIVAGVVAAAMTVAGGIGTVSQVHAKQTYPLPQTSAHEWDNGISSVTEPGPAAPETTEPEPTEPVPTEPDETTLAYQAYLELLMEEQEQIDEYNWQRGYYGYGVQTEEKLAHPVILRDICGDDTPELIYLKNNEFTGYQSASLCIVGYEDRQINTLYFQEYWDSQVGGGSRYYFYQLNGDKTLYAYTYMADDFSSNSYSVFEENGGVLNLKELYSYYSAPDYEHYTPETGLQIIVTCKKNGDEEITEEEYQSVVSDLKANTASVLMYNYPWNDFVDGFVAENGCPAMTCSAAITYLRVLLGLPPEETEELLNEPAPDLFEWIPSHYYFSSGAGAWGSSLSIQPDGSFSAEYHDSDMGSSGEGYDATYFYSRCTGRFVNPVKLNAYTYSVELESLDYDGVPGEKHIEDDGGARTLKIYSDLYGLADGETFYIYTPGAPKKKLPEEYVGWVGMMTWDSTDNTETSYFGLYNLNTKCAFAASSYFHNWRAAYRDFILAKRFLDSGDTGRGYGELYGTFGVVTFALADLNADEVPELIICNGFNGRDLRANYIFTFDGERVQYCGYTLADAYKVIGYPGLFSAVDTSGWYLDDQYQGVYDEVIYLNHSVLVDGQLETERVRITGYTSGSTEGTTIWQTDDSALLDASQRTAYLISIMMLEDIESQGWDAFEALLINEDNLVVNEVHTKTVKFDDDKSVEMSWGWNLFRKDASEYDHNLAMAGVILSQAAELSQSEAEDRLKTLGFGKCESVFYGGRSSDMQTPATSFASQAIRLDGKDYVIAAIVVRGSGDLGDWLTNFRSITDGFMPSAQNVRNEFINNYYKGLSNYYGFSVTPDNTILLITGHSQGGAVAGQLAQMLDGVCAPRSKTFVYTFASPNYQTFYYDRESFTNVHNLINKADFVPRLPDYNHRYGHDWFYDKSVFHLNYVNTVIDNHLLKTYLQCMVTELPMNMGDGAQMTYGEWCIHCPVDVQVFTPDGKLMAASSGSEVFLAEDSSVLLLTDGDEKYLYAPQDVEYTVYLTGTDNGSMSIEQRIFEYESGAILSEKEYPDLPLEPAAVYVASASVEEPEQSELYQLDTNGRIRSSVDESGRLHRILFDSELLGWSFVACAALGVLMLFLSLISIVKWTKRKKATQ